MDEEIKELLRQYLENQQSLQKMTGQGGTGADDADKKLKELASTLTGTNRRTEETREIFKELGISSKDLNAVQIAQVESAYKYNETMKMQVAVLKAGTEALKDFGKNLISQERGFTKYGKGLEGFGDSVVAATSKLPIFGQVIGQTVGVLTKLGSVYMEQADRMLKANDQLAQFGTAGSFTTKQLMEMAHGAGVTSKNMELFTKPITSLGSNLLTLGTTTGEGVKAFSQLTKFTNEQREGFQRLGISQEQMLQGTADYLALQAMSGRSIQHELKDRKALQQASLDYQTNLVDLAALTGQDVESLKKKQQEAARSAEFQIKQIQTENRARQLEAQGRTEEAKKLRDEAKARVQSLDQISALGNETVTKGVRAFMSTGTMAAEETQALIRMGLGKDLEALQTAIKKGENVQEATAKFQDAYNKKFGQTIDNVGFAAQHSKDVARQYGMDAQSLENFNRQRNTNFQEEIKKQKENREKAQKPGQDPAQDARAKLTTLEIEAGKAIDKLTAAVNPLLSGFNATTIAGTAAAAALGGLAIVAGKQAMGGMLKSGSGVLGKAMDMVRGVGAAAPVATTVAGGAGTAATAATAATTTAATAAGGAGTAATAATTAASALSKLAGPLAGLSKAAPMIGTVVSVGTGVIDAYQGVKKADKDLKEGKITKEEARTAKGEAVGGGAGTAIGGAAGALKGAAIGASIGSVVPVLGTAVGGIIGAALGGWMGAKAGKAIGEVAGGGIAKMTDGADKEVDKAKKAAETKSKEKEAKEAKDKEAKDKKEALGKDAITKVQIVNPAPLPVSIAKISDPNVFKALGQMSGEKPKAEDNKSVLGSAATGAASGALFGPIGMLVGALMGVGKSTTTTTAATPTATPVATPVANAGGTPKEKIAYAKEKLEEAQKAKLSAPKAAVGGIFDGPKSGYPVELHGKEMITPLGTGTKIDALPDSDEDIDEELEAEREAINKLKDTIKDTEANFKKLTGSIIELDHIQKEKVELEEDGTDKIESIQDKLKNVFNGAAIDLGKFSSKIKIITDTAGTGAGLKMPDVLGGILGGSAGKGTTDSGQGLKMPSAPSMPGMGGGTGITPPPVKQDVKQNLGDVKAALMKRGMGDEKYINAILGNVMKESGGKVINENLNYSKTSNERIRAIFGSRAAGKTDEELNQIKSSPESMGEFMYGKDTKIGRSMGNLEPGDGWKYRGRGYIQLTGKSNYAAASQAIFGDDSLVKNPDLVNDPKVAAEVVAWYMQRGKASMAKKMGIDDANMTQEQANLLATSQIAGVDVRRAGGYLGGEVMQKVSKYAASSDIQGIQPSQPSTMVASAKPKIPQAQRGGSFDGPESGYIVELHGAETVIPNDKIAGIKKGGVGAESSGDLPEEVKKFFQLQGSLGSLRSLQEDTGRSTFVSRDEESVKAQDRMATILEDMKSKLVASGYDKSWLENYGETDEERASVKGLDLNKYKDDMTTAELPTTAPSPDAIVAVSDNLKDLTENTRNIMAETLKTFTDNFKNELAQVLQKPAEGEGAEPKEAVTNLLSEKLDTMIEKLSKSVDTQDKLLQVARV